MKGVFHIRVALFDHSDSFWFVEASQIEEIGILVEFVKYSAGTVLDIGCGEYCGTVMREFAGESCSAVMVLEGGDTRRDFTIMSVVNKHDR